jgi:hypothetical protein
MVLRGGDSTFLACEDEKGCWKVPGVDMAWLNEKEALEGPRGGETASK